MVRTQKFPALTQPQLEVLIATMECSEPVKEVQEHEESALKTLREHTERVMTLPFVSNFYIVMFRMEQEALQAERADEPYDRRLAAW